MDLICGGRIKVLIEYLAADVENRKLFGCVHEELKTSRPFQWIGNITGEGGQLNVEHALRIAGGKFLGPLDITPEVQKQIESCRRVSNGFSFIEFENEAFFIELVSPPQTLFLFGAGHVSREIAVLSKRVGFRIVVIDDRVEFANAERFPEADEIRVIPEYAGMFTGVSPNPNDLIVIMTRGHSFDKEVLAQALKTEAGYIGMIGSHRKKETIYKKLIDQGVLADTLEQVHCPIGLPIEAETPAEIAVSVVAQLIHHRAGRKPNGG
jgi:xanthine dehydrogenase accessory factor